MVRGENGAKNVTAEKKNLSSMSNRNWTLCVTGWIRNAHKNKWKSKNERGEVEKKNDDNRMAWVFGVKALLINVARTI